ncbi:MAG: HDIG domain-containing metalloprotein [Vulcanimicrobiota bacterium]
MNRDDAWDLLNRYLKKDAMLKHSLASEAIMRGVAQKLGYDEELWGITGLLHDIDFEMTEQTPEKHAIAAMDLLPPDLPEEMRQAICRHNEANGSVRETPLDFALSASESLTGLIIATALVYPDKKISSVKVKSVTKRMKEKAFARNVSRECILECEKIGLSLDSFVETGIHSMEKIAPELGL